MRDAPLTIFCAKRELLSVVLTKASDCARVRPETVDVGGAGGRRAGGSRAGDTSSS